MKKNQTLVFFLIMILTIPVQAQTRNWTTVAGFNPGSAVIPEEGKKALRDLVSQYNKKEKVIRIIGIADTLGWENKSSQQGESADTVLAYKRAEQIAKFYKSIGWETEIVAIQNYIPNDQGYRGVQIQLVNKLTEEQLDSLILKLIRNTENPNDSEKHFKTKETSQLNWSFDIGLRTWISKPSWDLFVPTLGLSLLKEKWILSVGGGFTPWEYLDPTGNRRDALVFAEIVAWPESSISFKYGLLMGWETFSKSDLWTMKVITPFIGPSYTTNNFELSLLYSPAHISSLSRDPYLDPGAVMINIGIKIK